MAPAIAYATKGRFYIARAPRQNWSGQSGSAARSASISSKPRTWRTARPIPGRSARCAARSRRAAATAASRRRASPASAALVRQGAAGRGHPVCSTPMSAIISACCCCSAASSVRCSRWSISRSRSTPTRAKGDPAIGVVDGVLHSHDHRRRHRLAVRAGAGEPARRRGGVAPPDRPADERDRGAQAHRRQAAEGQGGGRGREQGQEPLCRRLEPRAAHAAQCHPRLCADPGARPGDPGAADPRRSRSCGAAPSTCPA